MGYFQLCSTQSRYAEINGPNLVMTTDFNGSVVDATQNNIILLLVDGCE